MKLGEMNIRIMEALTKGATEEDEIVFFDSLSDDEFRITRVEYTETDPYKLYLVGNAMNAEETP